ncbi:MAG: flagellar basal body P-ring formation chaperone FlgA, partial [Nannocystaceae bacterium]|nr:flagellar basal body P-ring formation chaperone FlgA [Nannocystaceae bacterium]
EPDLPANLLIGEVSVPATFVLEEGDSIRAQWRRTPKEGNAFALVELMRGDAVQRRAFVRIKLLAVHEVLVAQRELDEGDVISAGDLALEPRIGTQGVALAPISLVGSSVLKDVEFGQLVTATNVALPTPIARGTAVKVVIRVGGAKIESHGRLEVTARPGEQVRVRVRATHKIVQGLLIDPKTVEIQGEAA